MQVESKISELILYLLKKYQRIAIKGIGTLYYVQQDAFIDPRTNLIAPPRKILSITTIEDTDVDFAESSLKEGLISALEASDLKVFLSLKALVFSRDQNITIDELGTIHRNQGLLVLTPDSSLENVVTRLPKIKLKELSVVRDTAAKSTTRGNQKTIDAKEEIITEKASELSSIHGNAKVKNVISEKTSFLSTYGLPLFFLLLGIFLISLCFKTCFTGELNQNLHKNGNYVEPTMDRALDDVDPLTIENEMFTNPNLNKYRHVLTQTNIDEGCKIVVGTFDNIGNAQSLADDLEKRQYKVDLTTMEDLTRVVIKFDCKEEDLIEYFNKVRNDVSKKAWFLSPRYDPEQLGN